MINAPCPPWSSTAGRSSLLPDVSTIVRVDRLDPSKNVADGFEAYDLLLRRHPELRSKVRFLAFLIPSRDSIPEYCQYKERVLALAESINHRYGTPEWQPVTVFLENNRTRALAGLTLHDVLLVNSLADGLNLVSKEGSLLNERDGVLALSDMAGSYQELCHGGPARQSPRHRRHRDDPVSGADYVGLGAKAPRGRTAPHSLRPSGHGLAKAAAQRPRDLGASEEHRSRHAGLTPLASPTVAPFSTIATSPRVR